MQELSNNQKRLRDQAGRLRKKLYAEKPVKDEELKKASCGKTQFEWASTIRQAQKWKLTAISLKTRNQLLLHSINSQVNQIEEEKAKRKSAQIALSCLKRKVNELRYVKHANRNIINEAQHWKQMFMLRGCGKDKTITKDKRRDHTEELEDKLKAAQRKLSMIKSDADRLKNAQNRLTEIWTEMNFQTRLLAANQENKRLDAILARQIMQRATTNLRRSIVAEREQEDTKEWFEKKEKVIEDLRNKVKELTERGVNTNAEHEKKLEEKEEEIRYLEYLHDTIYQAFGNRKLFQPDHTSNANAENPTILAGDLPSILNLNKLCEND